MHSVLRLLGTRFGAAIGLVLLIALVIGIGKAIGGPSRQPLVAGPAASTAPASPTATPPEDDGMGSAAPVPGPSTSPGAPDPQTVALHFTTAWLNHTGVSAGVWHSGVAKYATTNLSTELDGTDPADVPTNRMTGQPTVIDHATSYVDVAIPCDGGTVTLRVLATNGRWLVDGVDWQRS